MSKEIYVTKKMAKDLLSWEPSKIDRLFRQINKDLKEKGFITDSKSVPSSEIKKLVKVSQSAIEEVWYTHIGMYQDIKKET